MCLPLSGQAGSRQRGGAILLGLAVWDDARVDVEGETEGETFEVGTGNVAIHVLDLFNFTGLSSGTESPRVLRTATCFPWSFIALLENDENGL